MSGIPPEQLLPGLFDPANSARPVHVAGTTSTYAALLAAARATAGRLTGLTRVAVLATPTLDTVTAVVAALLAGVEAVPVPPDSGPAELTHILRDSKAQSWLGPSPNPSPADRTPAPTLPAEPTQACQGVTPGHQPGMTGARDGGSSLTASGARPGLPGIPDTALILYTSGTTGPPKGVLLSRGAIAAGLDGLAEAWDWTARDTLAHGLPLFHVHGLILGVLGPLRLGGGLVHVGWPTPQAYAAAATNHRATMLFAVPTIWSRIAADPQAAAALRPARLLVSGSAALPPPVFHRLAELTGHEPVERYGMTETLITVATRADGEHRPGAVGRPIAGVSTRLRDEHGHPVPEDGESVGQLEVRGRTLFSGYLGRPEDTAAAFTPDGWFRTGDVATIDPEGVHRIVGRESVDLIKSGGYRIGAGEVETALLGHPAVRECAVVGLPDPDLGQRLVAYVVPAPGAEPDGAQLTAYVAAHLSAHKRPREVRFVQTLPRNELGKVQKARLIG